MEIESLVIDTNAYSYYNNKDTRIRKIVVNAKHIFLPLVVIGELKAGFLLGNKFAKNMVELDSFLSMNNLEILYPNLITTDIYADLFKQLRKKGSPIPTNDIWIAALALQHSASLVTLDKHFGFVDGLELIPIPDA